MWSARRGRLATLGAALALSAIATLGGGAVLGLASAAPGRLPGRHATAGGPSIGLADQTQWVVPQASGTAAFDLELTGRDIPRGASVEVVMYERLNTRFDFKRDVAIGPRGYPLSTAAPVAWTRLGTASQRRGTRVDDLSVVRTTSIASTGRLGLSCAPPTGTGTCTGVYPVSVQLMSRANKVISRFTTFLTYVAGKSAHPLELSWVVPLHAPVVFSMPITRPTRAVAPVSAGETGALSTLIAQLRRASTVPVTVEPSAETLQRMASSGGDGRAAVASLAQGSQDSAQEEVLPAPYVPINLGAFAGAGEPTEIVAQMAAGVAVLHSLGVATVPPTVWIASGAVGSDLAAGLSRVGATRLVLPDGDLVSTLTYPGTWASTYQLPLGKHKKKPASTVEAANTDTWLDGQFTSKPKDPALGAAQLLADLAMVHFERPNTRAVRGVVAVPPAGWTPNATFDRILLAGLTNNPVVKPVTISQFFSTVTPNGSRSLARGSKTGPVLQASVARAFSRARVRLTDFESAIDGHPAIEAQLDELLLSTEASSLGPSSERVAVSGFEDVLTRQLSHVTFATEKTFTLTARSGWIPVTILSSASYTVVGTLSVSGDKFTFPHRSSYSSMRLDHPTNPRRVDVVARTSGELPLHVEFLSPRGDLVIARGTLRVRSTATSVVGIVLSVLALLTLLTWWARTWWKGRKRRRALAATDAAGGIGGAHLT